MLAFFCSSAPQNWEFSEQGLMRKRIASINEAPIRPEERRIAVPEGQQVVYNSWLAEQVG